MMNINQINIPHDSIERLCERYGVFRLGFFGSILRDDFRQDSDIDMLVEFLPETRVGLDFIDLQDELTALFGRTVDLNTPAFLSRHFRQQVIDSARVIYERER